MLTLVTPHNHCTGIRSFLFQDRDVLVGESNTETAEPAGTGLYESDLVSDLLQRSYQRRQPGSGEMRHGTEGWQALESSFVVNILA